MPIDWLHTIIQAQSSAAPFQLCQMSRRGLLFSPPNVKSKLKVNVINYLVSGWNWWWCLLGWIRLVVVQQNPKRRGVVQVIGPSRRSVLWMLLFHSSWTHYEFCRAFLKGPTTLYLAQSRHKSVQTVSNVGSRWTEIGSLVKSWNTNTTSCAKKDSRSSFFCFNDGSSVAHAPPAKQHTTPAAPLHHTAHTVVVVV